MNTKRWWLFVLLVLLGVSACTSTPRPVESAGPSTAPVAASTVTLAADVRPEEVHAVYRQGGVTVIDVRELEEYQAGHIPGALLIPLGELPNRLNDLPRNAEVILVCRSGNRSKQAYDFLRTQGFTNIHNMLGGMKAWVAAGYEIER